jgi:hypothetical protein
MATLVNFLPFLVLLTIVAVLAQAIVRMSRALERIGLAMGQLAATLRSGTSIQIH